jgi:uncharacterized protein (DUF1697 family)
VAQRWVALLRGINVGTAQRVSMAELRGVASGLGYQSVSTLLNSGNLVFTSPTPGKASPGPALERAIAATVGFAVPVVALTSARVDAVVRANPLMSASRDPSRLVVAAMRTAAALREARALAGQSWGRDELVCGIHAAYLWCPDGIAKSRLVLAMNRALRDDVTMRNWATMLKLQSAARRLDD